MTTTKPIPQWEEVGQKAEKPNGHGASKLNSADWREIFHSYTDFENAPPLQFAINGFLQEAGITLIGGLAGHGKTLVMLAMAKALLEGSPLFGYEAFNVPRPSTRVLYLTPELPIPPFWARVNLFGLANFVQNDRLLVRTLSHRKAVPLSDPRLLQAAQGADIFLDTAVRFMDGSENDVESTRPFADDLFRLLAAGARSITGAHHAPKGFENQEHMSLQNILRGSGDIGAMLSTAWGVRQIETERNQLFIENIKPRDFQPCAPFIVEGRPHLDNGGQFHMLRRPGSAGELRDYVHRRNGESGRPSRDDKQAKLAEALRLRAQGKSENAIAKAVSIPRTTLQKWIFDHDSQQSANA